MPELPEVEVVRRGLRDHLVGRAFVTSRVTGARVARRHPLGPEHLAQALQGRVVGSAERRGKYLWMTFNDADDVLVVHLGMSGQVLVEAADAPLEKHAHAVFDLTPRGDGVEQQMRFVDQRTFGGLYLDSVAEAHGRAVPATIAHIAPDPIEAAFDIASVARLMRSKDVAVKRMLLDQTVVSGVGNIYADEALWRAGVHGRRPGRMLTQRKAVELLDHVGDVMEEALDQGGTSFDAMYVNVNGASGYFDRSLNAYGQHGKPCARCGTAMVREQFMNRGSHFCPVCQKAPRK